MERRRLVSRRDSFVPHVVGSLFGVLALSSAHAGPTIYERDGFQWSVIGDPGNRPTRFGEIPGGIDAAIGRVDYRYSMSVTEVTNGQYLEFVRVYWPIYRQNTGRTIALSDLVGDGLTASFAGVGLRPGARASQPASMGWEFAARYVNWLHNGRSNEPWAFESGVYDTSTFARGPDGVIRPQATRNPGSRYWIPDFNEWTKAAHWDPNRYGPGEGGYWTFPNGSDVESPSGRPEDGGGRNGGIEGEGGSSVLLDVGSYPDVQSPWGLLDLAGGQREWLEDLRLIFGVHSRLIEGSDYRAFGTGDPFSPDQIAYPITSNVRFAFGLRLATLVPAPASCLVMVSAGLVVMRRRG